MTYEHLPALNVNDQNAPTQSNPKRELLHIDTEPKLDDYLRPTANLKLKLELTDLNDEVKTEYNSRKIQPYQSYNGFFLNLI